MASLLASLSMEDWTTFWRYPLITGTFSVLLMVSLLFSEILKDRNAINYLKSQRFWFSTGLLLFYVGFIPVLFFVNQIDAGERYFSIIITLLNVLLYGSFIIGFTCQQKKN
ncbi:MAG: hypothetical protein ACPGEC_00200 [Flavobacteriales bacterium]